MPIGIIESLDHEGRGIARLDGKTIFVEGALPGEEVEYSSYRKKPSYELAQVTKILRASPSRVTPSCPNFGTCGGCSMQHASHATQVAAKQRVLEDSLWHIGRVTPEQLYPPIYGEPWGYRHRARIGARLVPKKGGVLIGFHERRSGYIADMKECLNLPRHVSDLLVPLRALVGALSIKERLPQIEIAVGTSCTVLVFRILDPLNSNDEQLLRDFADQHAIQVWLQSKGPETVALFHPEAAPSLSYTLPDFGLELKFSPIEFTQVNPAINRALLRRAMGLLQPAAGERIADMFCGLGNFTLPIARSGASVVGIEGSEPLTKRAAENAADNGLSGNTEFGVANLFEASEESICALGHFDKMLIDPPREGAFELVTQLCI